MDQAAERVGILEDARQQRDKNRNEFIAGVERADRSCAIGMHKPVMHHVERG
jgi:hypothetical protein